MRLLQMSTADFIATAEWWGEGAPPTSTSEIVLVDVTETPTAQLGDTYDPETDTWSSPPE